MKYYRTLLLILSFILAYGCSSLNKLQTQGKVSPENFKESISFETYKKLIFLDVKIDGKTKKFLFDTGADLSLIQRDSLKGKIIKVSGASKRKMKLGQEIMPLLEIGNIKFIDTHALNGDLVGFKEQIPNLGGIIGQSIIKKANWLIDYPNKKLEIANVNLVDESFKTLEIHRKAGAPYTFIEVNGIKHQVVIDLGSSSTINLPKDSKLAKELVKTIDLNDNTRDRYTLGGLQKINEKIGVISKVRLGTFTFENVDVNINTSSQPRIGLPFFKNYIIYIDNTNNGIYKLKKK